MQIAGKSLGSPHPIGYTSVSMSPFDHGDREWSNADFVQRPEPKGEQA
jgi:hypothetical protein